MHWLYLGKEDEIKPNRAFDSPLAGDEGRNATSFRALPRS